MSQWDPFCASVVWFERTCEEQLETLESLETLQQQAPIEPVLDLLQL